MVRKLRRKLSWSKPGGKTANSSASDTGNARTCAPSRVGYEHSNINMGAVLLPGWVEGKSSRSLNDHKPTDMERMKERFAKLLLGGDMTGGEEGVSSAVALSTAITDLAASIFGEQDKLQPMYPETKARWRKEIGWLLSVADHIVQFVPSQQQSMESCGFTEIMVTKPRFDLQMNIPALQKLDAMLLETLDNFGGQNEFWYVPRESGESVSGGNASLDEKWWAPVARVPTGGLSEGTRRWLHYQKDSVTQVLKAAMAVNSQILSGMEIPESYVESLPKNGKTTLGDSIYKSITEDCFDPEGFLSTLDLSAERKVLDLKNRIEASIVIWKKKMNLKDGKSSWGSIVSLERREIFEERAKTILVLLKQHFPGIPQSALDIAKIQHNMDVGDAILESYSRVLESLAFRIMSRIEDVIHADILAQQEVPGSLETEAESAMSSGVGDEMEKLGSAETPNSKTLKEFMGWNSEKKKSKSPAGSPRLKSPKAAPKRFSYLEKLEKLRSPTERH